MFVRGLMGKRLALVLSSEETYPGAPLGVIHELQEYARYMHSPLVAVVQGIGNSRRDVLLDPERPARARPRDRTPAGRAPQHRLPPRHRAAELDLAQPGGAVERRRRYPAAVGPPRTNSSARSASHSCTTSAVLRRSRPGELLDAAHPVDQRLLVHVQQLGRALPGAVLLEEHAQRARAAPCRGDRRSPGPAPAPVRPRSRLPPGCGEGTAGCSRRSAPAAAPRLWAADWAQLASRAASGARSGLRSGSLIPSATSGTNRAAHAPRAPASLLGTISRQRLGSHRIRWGTPRWASSWWRLPSSAPEGLGANATSTALAGAMPCSRSCSWAEAGSRRRSSIAASSSEPWRRSCSRSAVTRSTSRAAMFAACWRSAMSGACSPDCMRHEGRRAAGRHTDREGGQRRCGSRAARPETRRSRARSSSIRRSPRPPGGRRVGRQHRQRGGAVEQHEPAAGAAGRARPGGPRPRGRSTRHPGGPRTAGRCRRAACAPRPSSRSPPPARRRRRARRGGSRAGERRARRRARGGPG